MSMGQDDHINVSGRNPLGLQVLKKFSCVWVKTTCTCIHKHQMRAPIDQQTDVRAYTLYSLLWLEVMFAKRLLKAFFGRVSEKKVSRWWEGGGCVCVGAVADGHALEGP